MTTDTITISSSTFGFIMGGITLLGLIINMARFHLLSNKIKVLEFLLDETETFFMKAVENSLLIEPSFVRETEERLAMLKDRTCSLQSRAYNATTVSQDYAEFFRGTSTAIARACQSLKKLRAESSSEEGRRRLMEMNSAPQPQVAPSVPPLNHEPVNRPSLPPTAEINRPHSCPPSLSAWISDDNDTQSVTAPSNPFIDPTQIDSDVQIADVQNRTSTIDTSVNLELEA